VARTAVAEVLGADPAGLAFVSNATTGVNAVLRSFPWKPGDALLLADQTYNAVKQTARWVAQRYGVELQFATLPFPVNAPEDMIQPWLDAATPRTRLAVVDHISSPTAVILPVADILGALRARGIPVLIDGAHAPGILPLDLRSLDADFYVGNLHKWVYAAKGAAILYVRDEWRAHIQPPNLSHGYEQGLWAEFDWIGTMDPSAWLTAPVALDFYRSLPGVAASNHALVQRGRELIADALGTPLPHPDDPRLYGPMAATTWPQAFSGDFRQVQELNRRLYDEHRIEVPFSTYDHRIWLRISAQAFNHPEDYVRLAEVLRAGWR
jgi:isopenicillin-N epimerase